MEQILACLGNWFPTPDLLLGDDHNKVAIEYYGAERCYCRTLEASCRGLSSGLTSGTRYWFRVAAAGASGQGGWSDPATKIAP